MCVVALAWQVHPRWKLVVAGNRDERHDRPAAPLVRWDDVGILAGRDLRSGGTWLGVSDAGRFAVITNMRGVETPAPERVSRGRLVLDVLTGKGRYADPTDADLADFNPFNLIVANSGRVGFLANRPHAVRRSLDDGIYGLSNGALDEAWPKTVRLKAMLADWLRGEADRPLALLDMLTDDRRGETPDDETAEMSSEPASSPIFVRDPVYGTRCSTVVAIDRDGAGLILERRYDASAEVTGETTLAFKW
jgi:uncharacterized protein with NRDE domain